MTAGARGSNNALAAFAAGPNWTDDEQYWEGEGQRNPYCLAVIPPKLQKLRKSFQARVKSAGAPA